MAVVESTQFIVVESRRFDSLPCESSIYLVLAQVS